MIITSNGEVLTNNHVIDDTINIKAQIVGTGTTYSVKVIGYDATDDVALVQLVGASNLPTISLGNSSNLSPGDAITVLGNALGKGGAPAVPGPWHSSVPRSRPVMTAATTRPSRG